MCAKKLSVNEKETSTDKIALEEVLKDPAIDDERAIRALRTSMDWRDWFRNDFLRYCYIVAALAVDILLILEIGRSYSVYDMTGSIILIVLFVIGLVAAYFGYAKLWPEGILTGRSKES